MKKKLKSFLSYNMSKENLKNDKSYQEFLVKQEEAKIRILKSY